jgi:hypothetical protein
MRPNLLLELLLVGIFTIILDFFVYRIMSGKFPGPHLAHFRSMITGAFLLGSSMHFILEIAGINKKWCQKEFPLARRVVV